MNTSDNQNKKDVEICAITELTPKPGKKQELVDLFKNSGSVEKTRLEDGCIMYECCEKEGSDNVIFVQKWRSLKDLESHKKQPHLALIKPEIDKLIEGKVVISRCPRLID